MNGRPLILTYNKLKKSNRQWYRNKGNCQLATKSAGQQCDEYPMYKTNENRGSTITVSIRWVSGVQNGIVGGHFGFLARNMDNQDKFLVVTSDSLPTFALPLGKNKKK